MGSSLDLAPKEAALGQTLLLLLTFPHWDPEGALPSTKMHFAMPPRRGSQQSAYAAHMRTQRAPLARRVGPKQVVLIVFGLFTLLFLLGKLSGSGSDDTPAGTAPVVLVTLFDADSPDKDLQDIIRRNREEYAARHGYATFFTTTKDYFLDDAPTSWAKVPSMRHAMTRFPHSTFYWFLSSTSIITNMGLPLHTHILTPSSRLSSLLLTDIPIVPPDSIIKTFSGVKGDSIDLVITQDKAGLSTESFVVRRGDWAKYFLDAWFDPLYRSYNFQKAETHALEHIVQWHGTILAKVGIVPLRVFNSYPPGSTAAADDSYFQPEDFVINNAGCAANGRSCRTEMAPYLPRPESP